LQRFLAQGGVAARRKAEALIVSGAVRVNGQVVTTLGSKVDPARDQVTVHGEAVVPEETFYCVLNKPKGCVTTVSDPQGRRTVMEYLPNLPASVVPVGRLDYYSEGVLLLTNDGELAAALLSPRHHVEKTYHVKIKGGVSDANLQRLRDGVRIERNVVTGPAQVDRLGHESKHDWLVITLTEGKSRQIHRMAEALGLQALKIQRVAFGGITFHGLRVGDARELTQAEVNELRQQVGLPRSAIAAGRGRWSARRETTDVARRARDRERDEAMAAGAEPRPPREPRESRPGRRERAAAKPPSRRSRPHGTAEPPRSRRSEPPRSRRSEPPRSRRSEPPRSRPDDRGRVVDRGRAKGRGRPRTKRR
jgi:23S rRNA pseudouridine2605 synthase